ncbi:hypothetical protein [Kordiimonas laminariae]|uniref:hypothetical protein n=1 Tax=Kordiimonas laminariae TaxID=2917717 RepID=UPI001FF34419|nr:hypothetical protein [Kordiimonas laminariae]MCK0069653.1 hypothetical protein [Kordiimonas laminariae]
MALSVALASMPIAADERAAAQKNLEAFEQLFGVTKGMRRNHTKGFCFTGEFIPQGSAIQEHSNSPIFREKSTVRGRLSHKGGKPNPADDTPGHYGLAFEITAPNDEKHIMNMNTEHFFPVSTTEAFIELLRAKAAGAEATAAFAAKHPELKFYNAYHAEITKNLKPYEGAVYNSINTFHLVAEDGRRSAVRWSFVPSGEQGLVIEPTESFFFENIQANLKKGKVVWDMLISFASEGDDILNPAIKWSDDNTKILAAKLKVTNVMQEEDGTCDRMNFDPTLVTEGFDASEDPMLRVRSAIYAVGAERRLSEK